MTAQHTFPKMKKLIAARVISVNGQASPCDCEDAIVCSYCVQANLVLMEKKFQSADGDMQLFIERARKNGIRKTARQLGVAESNVRLWIKNKNAPRNMVEILVGVRS